MTKSDNDNNCRTVSMEGDGDLIEKAQNTKKELIVHYKLNFKCVCLVTVSIPSIALIVCVISAVVFQYDDVFNIIPSISAVTGISPQRYIWRISIALHVGPRVIICAVYNAYQLNSIKAIAPLENKMRAQMWLNLAYILNLIETGALCGVTYISNVENYPMHEKLFIMFMISSLGHMIACIQGTKFAAETRRDLHLVKEGLKYKQNLLIMSLFSTVTLIGFFYLHRWYCMRLAFSIFSLSEYIITAANVAFHISVILDFPTEDLIVGKIIHTKKID
ncbi:post-GPI attachment to proteins factor 2-like isoform X2 [Cylas formicarius]|uniref:post-GPI attachment to proteins factor 2-like isoform X2 n=1 Tax=Cylas formicarius TaxID=197179 RepID=UPI00295837BD|nr:post-GPI attachment to proteins factor 2-like isoform X2 [Cylas formicarius]